MLRPGGGTAWFGTTPSHVYDAGKSKRKEFAILNKNKNTQHTQEYLPLPCILKVLQVRDPLGDVGYQEAELKLVTEEG